MLKNIILPVLVVLLVDPLLFAQNATHDLILNPGYFNNNNQVQYLKVNTKAKIDGKFKPVAGIPVSFYISADAPANLLGKAVSDRNGEAVLFIPPAAKDAWNRSSKQSFFVVSAATGLYKSTSSDLDITKSKIKIDTIAGKKIIATLQELRDSVWVPVKGADIKVAIKRLNADLNVNETPAYTTDSLGTVAADFQRDSLPGDARGNITLIAKVEDNDAYGNITAELTVPWGVPGIYASDFNRRTLFARRGLAPVWLEITSFSIFFVVWIVLLYLIVQIWKLKKLGTQAAE
ncbi:hypothetical protein A3860_19785 [Niastella vici]|uniref:Uncharacterized protein n=2 Tax=Niastella vici TaxID=1703345 RepID=A0A1V9G0S7_9BACT|nr:hypothetical protein A3860_19785 [Niastella vici]